MLSEAVRNVIESGTCAHVVTIDPDGRPNITLAWVGLRDDDIVIGTLADQRKLANMRRQPRVAISFQTDKTNDFGLREYLIVHGTAEVTEGGAPELLQELAERYIGPGVKFPPMPNPPPGYVTRISVDKIGGVGPWA